MLSATERTIIKNRLATDPEQFPRDFSFEEIVDLIKRDAAENADFDTYMECLAIERG